MSPERSVDRNEPRPPDAVGIEPPAGCSLPTKLSLPRIAVPAMCNKTSNMNALLIHSHALNAAISALILGSDTLKAWFAYRICHAGGRGRLSHQWTDIEHWFDGPHSPLLVDFQENNGVFRVCNDPGWLEGTEFFARVVFTLMHKIQDNPTGTPSHGERLIYHPYYQTQQQKLFLAYRFLLFLTRYTGRSSRFCIIRPTAQRKLKVWETSLRGKIGAKCERFIEGKLPDHYSIMLAFV